jgi:hypothetical protein
MRWPTVVAASIFVLSGCVSVAETSSTPTPSISETLVAPKTETKPIEEAMKDALPAFVPTRFVCIDKDDMLKFVNVDMFQEGRTAAQQSAELRGLSSRLFSCRILQQVFYLIPFERVLRYTDQSGLASAVYQVYIGQRTGYVVAIDNKEQKKDMGFPI